MTDMDPRNAPGYATMTNGLQSFASEMQRMSKDAMEQTSQHMERLRGARSMEDVVSIQTAFLQQSFNNYADYTRRFSELMMTLPMELARQGQAAYQQGTNKMTQAAEQVGEEAKRAGERMTHG